MERIVHVCTGDAVADQLSLADLPGEIVVLAGDDQAIAAAEEVILWFGHDVADQLALAKLLSRLARAGLPPALTIVSIDRHDAVPAYLGFFQLAPEQLAELWPRRAPISKDALDEAAAAHVAVTAADPRAIPFVAKRVKALPFLAGALERHLEDLPDPASGLSRTERQLLAGLARGESGTALVDGVQANDPRFLLAPAAVERARAALRDANYLDGDTVTPLGRQALAGAVDRATAKTWRWDGAARRLVER